jgi:hypothetical protein
MSLSGQRRITHPSRLISFALPGTWAGPTVDGRWVVGTQDRHVLFAHSPKGVIALLRFLSGL